MFTASHTSLFSASTRREAPPPKNEPAAKPSTQPFSRAESFDKLKRALKRSRIDINGVTIASSAVPPKKCAADLPTDENRPSDHGVPGSRQRTLSSSSDATVRASSARTVRRRLNTKTNQGGSSPSTTKMAKADPKGAAKHSPSKSGRHKRQDPISFGALDTSQDENEEEDITAITARLFAVAPVAALSLAPALPACFFGSDDDACDTSFLDLSDNPEQSYSKSHSEASDIKHLLRSNYTGYCSAQSIKDSPWHTNGHVDGRTQYGHDNLQLGIRLYQKDITVWDAQDDAIFAVPAQLLLKCANLGKAEFDPGAAPDVYCVELRCYTAGRKSPHSHQPRLPVFSTCYSGAMVPNLTRNGPPAVLDDKRGVHIEQTWHPTMDKDGVWGWYVRVWMPIPMGIFDKMETRLFKVDAKVWIDEAGDEEKAFEAGAEFTLSNLLKGRIMGPGMTMSGRLV